MTTQTGLSLIAIGLMFASVSAGCAGDLSDEHTGTIDLSLELGAGVTIDVVTWTISNPSNGFTRSANVNVKSSNTLQFLAGGIPAAPGYTMSLAAKSVDGAFTCSGAASFDVMVDEVTPVAVTMNCSTTPAGQGSVVVVGTTQVCANLDSVSVSPLETAVNTPISLSATGSAGTLAVSFAWTATAGTFDSATSATPTFTCPATPGPVTITVVVSPSGPTCPTVTTQSVTVTCDALEPTFTNVYSSIISARCIGCHKPGGPGATVGMLDMSTPAAAYTNLIGVAAQGTGAGTSGITCASTSLIRVVPSNSGTSLLYNKTHSKLVGVLAPCGSPMPAGSTAPPLTAAQVDLIAAWIDGGAQNN